jgi:DNA-binding CsgD family transcriptional regulator
MTQVTVVRLADGAVLSGALPLRVTAEAAGQGGLEPDVVDTVTVSFDSGAPVEASLTIVASGAKGTVRVRVQVLQIPAPASSADSAAEIAEANRSSVPALAAPHSLPAQRERGDTAPAGRGARGPGTPGGLTGRELEIMLLVARGNTSRQIGVALFISPRTVEMHVQGSLLKLGCRTRAEAVRRLAELGTLPPVA